VLELEGEAVSTFGARQEGAEGGHPGGAEGGHRRCLEVEAGLALCPWKMNLPK
jgi:hypothetical protein